MNRIGNKKMIFVLLVIAAVGTAFLFLPVRHWFAQVTGLIEGLGPVAPFVFVLGYAVLTLFLIPGSAMTIGAGTVFGLWIGVALVVIGSNLGAFAAFILSRTLMRDRVAEWAAENPKFAALDQAIGREGFKMVLLARLSPVFPFTLLNYLLGLTTIRPGAYLLANFLGMLPGTFLYTYIGAAARDALGGDSEQTSLLQQVMKYVGLMATTLVVLFVTRMARRALAEAEKENAHDIDR